MRRLVKTSLLLFLALAAGTTAFAATSVAVLPEAAMNGTNYGLKVTWDGTTSHAYVRDDTPNAEQVYRATFWLDATNAVLGAWDRTAILELRETNNWGAIVARVQLQSNGYKNRVRAFCIKNDGTQKWVQVGGSGNRFINIDTAGPIQVTFEVTFSQNFLGGCSLTAEGQTIYNTGFNNGFRQVDTIRFGSQNPYATMSGYMYLDEFQSFRTLAP